MCLHRTFMCRRENLYFIKLLVPPFAYSAAQDIFKPRSSSGFSISHLLFSPKYALLIFFSFIFKIMSLYTVAPC